MKKIGEIIEKVHAAAKEFGAVFPKDKEEKNKLVVNAVEREVTEGDNVKVKFYAIIDETQPPKSVYSGLSFVIFPDIADARCIVSIACGTGGLDDDRELALLPGLRRGILRIQKKYNKANNEGNDKENKLVMTCKRNFTDIETKIKFTNIKDDNFKEASKAYGKCILASQEVLLEDVNRAVEILKAWLALYAKYREWGKENNINETLAPYYKDDNDIGKIQKEISELLLQRRFVVLQGAPGTGKTWLAAKIAKEGLDEKIKFSEKVIFTQFHAETSYADFICGIFPDTEGNNINNSSFLNEQASNIEQHDDKTNSDSYQHQKEQNNATSSTVQLKYVKKKGALCQAIEAAKQVKDQHMSVLLVIDEINRANLSNVLGEAFYLFEPDASERNNYILVGDEYIEKLPDNLYVLATMNTSDRSLAVIDFALRRRFAWYTLKPISLEKNFKRGKKFHTEEFQEFAMIFEKYATDSELSLQPGQAYFITSDQNSKQEMNNKLKYELMPLIKEYLQEGLLSRAEKDFSDLFFKRLSLNLYE